MMIPSRISAIFIPLPKPKSASLPNALQEIQYTRYRQ
jgi:hypothetical protein